MLHVAITCYGHLHSLPTCVEFISHDLSCICSHYMLSKFSFAFIRLSFAGYKSLSRLRNLEILDLSSHRFNNSIFPFLNAATSLTTLFLTYNNMHSPFLVKGVFLHF